MLSRKTFTYVLLISFFSLQGCLGTTHHFKTGHLLKSGDYSYTYGYSPGTAYQCAGDVARDRDNNSYCPATLKKVPIHSFSRSFRLGVRDQWGPLPGVEIGYQIEIPNTLEFDLTLGLPHPFTLKFAHATSIGWGLGLWPDNTYFVDYSAGYQTNNFTFFTSIRNAWHATQAYDLELSSEEKDTSTG